MAECELPIYDAMLPWEESRSGSDVMDCRLGVVALAGVWAWGVHGQNCLSLW